MGMAKPTGGYAEQMLVPGGWPEANEDTHYDRANDYTSVLHQVTDVMERAQHEKGEVFNGGVWSGGAADAANGKLGADINQMMTLQNDLTNTITWHKQVAGILVQAKSTIGNNVDMAQRQIDIWNADPDLDPEARTAAINSLISDTLGANVGIVGDTAEQVSASKNWKAPNNALTDLLSQKTPPGAMSASGGGAPSLKSLASNGGVGDAASVSGLAADAAANPMETLAANAPTAGEMWATVGQVNQLQQASAPLQQGFQQGMQMGQQMQGMSQGNAAGQSAQLASDQTAEGDENSEDKDKDNDKDNDNDNDNDLQADANGDSDGDQSTAFLAHGTAGAAAGADSGSGAAPVDLVTDRSAPASSGASL